MNVLELSEQEIGRRQSLQELRAMGINPYPAAELVDTTGAGDTFTGNMLNFLLERTDQKNTGADGLQEEGTGVLLEDLEADELERMLKRANAGASLIVRRRGALRMMPEPEEITALCGEK